MKKNFILFALLAVTAITLSSCGKEKINNTSLSGTWNVTEFKEIGINQIGLLYDAVDLTFTDGGDVTYTFTLIGASGTEESVGTYVADEDAKTVTITRMPLSGTDNTTITFDATIKKDELDLDQGGLLGDRIIATKQ